MTEKRVTRKYSSRVRSCLTAFKLTSQSKLYLNMSAFRVRVLASGETKGEEAR